MYNQQCTYTVLKNYSYIIRKFIKLGMAQTENLFGGVSKSPIIVEVNDDFRFRI